MPWVDFVVQSLGNFRSTTARAPSHKISAGKSPTELVPITLFGENRQRNDSGPESQFATEAKRVGGRRTRGVNGAEEKNGGLRTSDAIAAGSGPLAQPAVRAAVPEPAAMVSASPRLTIFFADNLIWRGAGRARRRLRGRNSVRAFRPNQSLEPTLARGPQRLRRTVKTRQKVQLMRCKNALTGQCWLNCIVRQKNKHDHFTKSRRSNTGWCHRRKRIAIPF